MLVCRVILSLYRCLFPCTVTMPFHPVACMKYKLTFVPCNVAGLTVHVSVNNLFPLLEKFNNSVERNGRN